MAVVLISTLSHSDVNNYIISNGLFHFGSENIYTNQKKKLVKEECSREYAHRLRGVVKFQTNNFTCCESNLIEPRRVITSF